MEGRGRHVLHCGGNGRMQWHDTQNTLCQWSIHVPVARAAVNGTFHGELKGWEGTLCLQ